MSRYKAYPSYKETRHSWLESVPAHWKMLPLKFLTAQHVTDGPHETPEFIDEGVPFLSVDGIQNNHLVFEGCRYISKEDHARYSIKCKPNQGDVLLGKAASVGKVAHVDTDFEFNVWSPLAVIRPRSEKTGRFIYYSLQSALLQMQCDMYSNANTQKNLGMSTIDNLAFASPTDDEAEQIAYFLDHETAKIDVLIEKQQRLIELLKEKRQAVISHAVTKGLSPNATMKDSGVEWLGEVPAHWEVSQLRYVVREGTSITYGIVQAGPEIEDGVPYIRTSDMSGDALPLTGYPKTSPEIDASYARSKVNAGDLVISIRASVGKCLPVPHELDGANLTQGTAKIAPSSKALAVFMLPFIGSSPVQLYLDSKAKGATFKEITLETLRKAPFLVPPVDEQEEIGRWVGSEELRFNALIATAEQAQVLLKERRTALISAAVTGKIDVRDWQAVA